MTLKLYFPFGDLLLIVLYLVFSFPSLPPSSSACYYPLHSYCYTVVHVVLFVTFASLKKCVTAYRASRCLSYSLCDQYAISDSDNTGD